MYWLYFQGRSLECGTRGKGLGRFKADCKVLAGVTPRKEFPFTAVGRWWEEQLGLHMDGQIRSLVLFILTLRYLLNIKSELFSRQLDVWVWDSRMTSGPKKWIWQSLASQRIFKAMAWMRSLGEEGPTLGLNLLPLRCWQRQTHQRNSTNYCSAATQQCQAAAMPLGKYPK